MKNDPNFSFKMNKQIIFLIYKYCLLSCESIEFKKNLLNSNYSNEIIKLFLCVEKHMNEIILIIEKKSNNWRFKRMNSLEQAILIFGTFFLIYRKEFSKKIVIWFSVEMAKNYCNPKAFKLINGILDNIN